MKLNFYSKSEDEANRRLCERIQGGLDRDRDILEEQNTIQLGLARDLPDAEAELRDTNQALERARSLANAANMVSLLPGGGLLGRALRDGVSAVTGIAAAKDVSRLEGVVARLETQIRTMEREKVESKRLTAQHSRLRDQAMAGLRENNCGFPIY